MPAEPDDEFQLRDVQTVEQYVMALRQLRRRDARRRSERERSYRAIAAATGIPHSTIGGYLSGKRLIPTDSADLIVQYLGASPSEQKLFANARDRVDENQRNGRAGSTQLAADSDSRALTPAHRDDREHEESARLGAHHEEIASAPAPPSTARFAFCKRTVLLATVGLAVLALAAWNIVLLTGHNVVDPGCTDQSCVYLHKSKSVALKSSSSTGSATVQELPNKTPVTMLCWTDTEHVRRPTTNYPSARWFRIRAGAAIGYVPSGTVFNQAKVDHC